MALPCLCVWLLSLTWLGRPAGCTFPALFPHVCATTKLLEDTSKLQRARRYTTTRVRHALERRGCERQPLYCISLVDLRKDNIILRHIMYVSTMRSSLSG